MNRAWRWWGAFWQFCITSLVPLSLASSVSRTLSADQVVLQDHLFVLTAGSFLGYWCVSSLLARWGRGRSEYHWSLLVILSARMRRSLARRGDEEGKEQCPMSHITLLTFQCHLQDQLCVSLCMQEIEITFSCGMCCADTTPSPHPPHPPPQKKEKEKKKRERKEKLLASVGLPSTINYQWT